MTLLFPDQRPFTTGSRPYLLKPPPGDAVSKVFFEIEIRNSRVEVMLDTAAPYLIVGPEWAQLLGLQHESPSLPTESIRIRGEVYRGRLERLQVRIRAEAGESLDIETTVWVPDPVDTED